jgi:hypothetical protein
VSSTPAKALQELLFFNAAVLQRLHLVSKSAGPQDLAKLSRSLIKSGKISPSAYLSFMAQSKDTISKVVTPFVASGKNDRSLDIVSSLRSLMKSLDGRSVGNVFAEHVTLLNKLDIAITLAHKK